MSRSPIVLKNRRRSRRRTEWLRWARDRFVAALAGTRSLESAFEEPLFPGLLK